MRLIDADNAILVCEILSEKGSNPHYWNQLISIIEDMPTIDAIPVEWLNERHRKCCEEGDTDLMDAITMLCNEYHVWQREQEAR